MSASPSPETFRSSFLLEFEIAERQLLQLAAAIPSERFGWRPDAAARSISEVFVHVAAGCFFLLELTGRKVPVEIYGHITTEGEERLWSVIRSNDELEAAIDSKDQVIDFLTRSLNAVREAIAQMDDASLDQPLIRGAFMRLIAHSHEHMGQMIAYVRFNGIRVPWPDWRPDRQG